MFPGLFQDSAVSVKQGKLWIKASAQMAQFQGRTWTHQGGGWLDQIKPLVMVTTSVR